MRMALALLDEAGADAAACHLQHAIDVALNSARGTHPRRSELIDFGFAFRPDTGERPVARNPSPAG